MQPDRATRRAVVRGALWLDAIRPDWFREISLRILDLTDPCTCILGQLYGEETSEQSGYTRGKIAFGANEAAMARLGFNGPGVLFSTPLWKNEVRKRRYKGDAK